MLNKISKLFNCLESFVSCNWILLGLYFPTFYIKKMSKASFCLIRQFIFNWISSSLPLFLMNFKLGRFVIFIRILNPSLSNIITKFIQRNRISAWCWYIMHNDSYIFCIFHNLFIWYLFYRWNLLVNIILNLSILGFESNHQ